MGISDTRYQLSLFAMFDMRVWKTGWKRWRPKAGRSKAPVYSFGNM